MNLKLAKILLAIMVLLSASWGIYWLAHSTGQVEPNNIGFITFGDKGIAFDMALDDDTLYVSAREGVYSFNTTTIQNRGLLKELEGISYAKSILLDEDGKVWIGHNQGISVYDPNTGKSQLINEQKGLPDNRVNSLSCTVEGSIWVGTWNGAVSIEDKIGEVINQDKGLMVDMVSEIYADKGGGIWFGSAVSPQGGLSYFHNGRWDYYDINNGLPHNSINDIYSISDSEILVATGFYDKGGLCCLSINNDRWVPKKTLGSADGVLDGKIRSIFQDDSGIMWIGYEFQGISLIKDGKSILLTMSEGLPHNEVMKVMQDRNSNYWLATAGGVAYIEKERIIAYFNRM